MIDGVFVKRLKVIPDERGRLVEILREDDLGFLGFGQVYLSTTLPGVVKGWHKHLKQIDNVVCVQGMVKLVLYDDREDLGGKDSTRWEVEEFYIGVHNPLLIQIPAGVWHGWKCVSLEEALIVNIPTIAYNRENPDEVRMDPHSPDIPYDWARKDK